MNDMPTEHPIIRRKENGYTAEQTDPYGRQAREWLEYTACQQNIDIQHKFNSKEKQLGHRHIRVDGWHAASHTVFQFHGCLFHGHDCYLTRNKDTHPYNGKSFHGVCVVRSYLIISKTLVFRLLHHNYSCSNTYI